MNTGQHTVCLMLGSNIQPKKHLKQALGLLQHQISIVQISDVWKTPAVGSRGPDFLNAAVLAKTAFGIRELKGSILRPLEAALGRVRVKNKNAPRTIDIDVIIFDDVLMDESLWQQAYLAVPVSEIFPCYRSEEGVFLTDAARTLTKTTPITLVSGVLDKINAEGLPSESRKYTIK